MPRNRTWSAVSGLFEVFGSAVAVSSAIEANRKPQAHHLRRLGIDPVEFDRIGKL